MGLFNSSLESRLANEMKIRKIEDFLELATSSFARAYPELLRPQTRLGCGCVYSVKTQTETKVISHGRRT
ncbi:MAG: hypothetical protein ABSD92_14470 [Candidatus Bathyarchaeia archaeon]|jgi:hypothetical protein